MSGAHWPLLLVAEGRTAFDWARQKELQLREVLGRSKTVRRRIADYVKAALESLYI